MNWPASTNRGTALLRYLHQHDPERLVRDDYVGWFVDPAAAGEPPKPPADHGAPLAEGDPAAEMALIAYRYTVVREEFFDELIEGAIARGACQLLLLGAGFDTRCLRLETLAQRAVRVVEVDLPETIEEKVAVLERHLGALPANLVPIALDLAREPLDALFARGLDRERPTVCIWQGVSYYLVSDAVSRVLDFMARSLPGASTIGFDACTPLMLDGKAPLPAIRFNIERTNAIGEPYRFGMAPDAMHAWLAAKGFRDVALVDQQELERRYLRRPLLPPGMWYVVTART